MFDRNIPLSLYIHFPWCVHKCVYCDFHSYGTTPSDALQAQYVAALIADLNQDLFKVQYRKINSIFMGGGTPSLFSVENIAHLLTEIQRHYELNSNIEITLEANPETLTEQKLQGYLAAGINRLSIGVQSFQDAALRTLGRIHDAETAKRAIKFAQKVGFKNINVDLMVGLPNQTAQDALDDLKTALNFDPTHLSWYELTLEPETTFAKNPPCLPNENLLIDIQQAGQQFLRDQNYHRYEISAYCKRGFECQHNLNYWQFGDYLGLGAGAHAKITDFDLQKIVRYEKEKLIEDYLDLRKPFVAKTMMLNQKDLPLEFMMNALRLIDGVSEQFFEARTGLSVKTIESVVKEAQKQNFMCEDENYFQLTSYGINFLNECLAIFT